jgi:hypothetical protein
MVELVDTLVLEASALCVRVRVSLGAPISGCRITAITLAFQASDEGSTPSTRSNLSIV